MSAAIGMSVANKQALYNSDFGISEFVKWEDYIREGKSGGGLLRYPNETPDEIVYFYAIPEVNWTISSHENSESITSEISKLKTYITIGAFFLGLFLAIPISFAARRVGRQYEKQIEKKNVQLSEERQKSDRLLLNILPESIAERMKNNEKIIVDHFSEVTVLFCDIVNFTAFSSHNSPEKIVDALNQVFSEFDKLTQKYRIEKIKTIGDAYMAVCGAPEPAQDHAQRMASMALEMIGVIKKIDLKLDVRIGLHCGEVVAGVIGTAKFSYDLWGNTVNVASRMESHGETGKIHCSETLYETLKEHFEFRDRGMVNIKGKGELSTYFLLSAKD